MAQQGHGDADGGTHRFVLASGGVEYLLAHEGKVPLTSVDGKTTCLFFSANWCRPCRNFEPKLVQLYNTLKADGEEVEIIFVSLDRDEAGFNEHFRHMPWLAVPYDAQVQMRLSNRYQVERIPSLIPLASDGKTVEEDGVQLVEDYGLEAYPFGAKRKEELKAMDQAKRQGGKLEDLLGSRERNYVISGEGTKVPIMDLVGKTVGLCFSAHWCPPCRTFTTMLAEAYIELRSTEHASFEIVFISSDKDEDGYKASLNEMPWLAVPYSEKTGHDLSRIFNVGGIPTLVLLGPDGKALSNDGRAMISSYGARAFPFTKARMAEVEESLIEEGEALPREVRDSRHQHLLKLDVAKAYVCDLCGRRGSHWVFSCDHCDFDMHPACVEETRSQA